MSKGLCFAGTPKQIFTVYALHGLRLTLIAVSLKGLNERRLGLIGFVICGEECQVNSLNSSTIDFDNCAGPSHVLAKSRYGKLPRNKRRAFPKSCDLKVVPRRWSIDIKIA